MLTAVFLALPALAQQALTEEQTGTQAMLQAAVSQREQVSNQLISAAGRIAILEAQLKAAQAACPKPKDEKK